MALESRDISQKLRQTKCLLFKIWRLKFTVICTKKSHLALGNSAKLVFWSILSLKSKHLVCLSFWDISRDSRAKIYHSMDKMWALLYWIDKNDLSICILQNKRIRTQYAEIIFIGNILIVCTIVSKIYFRNIYATRIFFFGENAGGIHYLIIL